MWKSTVDNKKLRCNDEKNDIYRIHYLFSYANVHNICTIQSKVDYPSNRNKSFVGEDVFYERLDKKMYREYNNAAYSVRKKVLFKEVPGEEFSFLQKQPWVAGVKWCFKIFRSP